MLKEYMQFIEEKNMLAIGTCKRSVQNTKCKTQDTIK